LWCDICASVNLVEPPAWDSTPLSFLRDMRRHAAEFIFGRRLRTRSSGTWGISSTEHSASKTSTTTSAASGNFYSSTAWRVVRYKALLRARGTCQCCGAQPTWSAPLHVDHIKPRSRHPHLALSLDNLQVLCEACNLGKLAWDETDWRHR